jgi:Na+/citrate or Na+/malate symporter
VTLPKLAVAAVVVAVLVLIGMAFGLSFERAAFLAPVLVLIAGGIAFLLVLWGKVIYESLRSRRRSASSNASTSDSSL